MTTDIENAFNALEQAIDNLNYRFGVIQRGNRLHRPYFKLLKIALKPLEELNQDASKKEIAKAKELILRKKKNIDEHLGFNGFYQRCKVQNDNDLTFSNKLTEVSRLLAIILKRLLAIEKQIGFFADDETCIEALKAYTYKRALQANDYAYSMFSFSCLFFNFSKQEKVNATNHLINLIDGSTNEPLTGYEMRILKNGELGKVVNDLAIDLCNFSHPKPSLSFTNGL